MNCASINIVYPQKNASKKKKRKKEMKKGERIEKKGRESLRPRLALDGKLEGVYDKGKKVTKYLYAHNF